MFDNFGGAFDLFFGGGAKSPQAPPISAYGVLCISLFVITLLNHDNDVEKIR